MMGIDRLNRGRPVAETLLAIPVLLHTLIIALYCCPDASLNLGNASDDILISGIAAQPTQLA